MGSRTNFSKKKKSPHYALGKVEGIFKRFPEIGDCPKKVLSNPSEGSIEPQKRFYRTPFSAPKRFYRTLVRVGACGPGEQHRTSVSSSVQHSSLSPVSRVHAQGVVLSEVAF